MAGQLTQEGFFSIRGGEFEDVAISATELKSAMTKLNISAEDTRRAAVVAFEAEMNVIIHAIAGTMTYEIFDDKVVLRVSDMGKGIPDIPQAMREGYTTAPAWAKERGWGSGLGLANIDKNCDHLKMDSVVGEGTTLTITVNFTKAPEAREVA
jgi:serine/threonine-protein kinase RsbT